MPKLENVVAVDWRSGKDRCYFFFKDSNTYTRFNIGDNQVPDDYPSDVKESNWGAFHPHVKHLRFGFSSNGIMGDHVKGIDDDFLWLFYKDNGTPMVCKYDQDKDNVAGMYPLATTFWAPLLPYFDRIIAGTWWKVSGYPYLFRFLMNDGRSIQFEPPWNNFKVETINSHTWPGLSPYKDRIITAVQNDRTFADSYYYVFLTNNQYIRYNIEENKADSGLIDVDDESWPGLLRD
ncbi:hypothetical protein SAMN04487857_109206 [Pseudomonas sp. ok272]|uniref:hypothetical protein n=1 Tax=unclassified Pseudomonas TaxID=196821 RepID=UPI0008D6B554|nr:MULTISPECIES: hypothetical protein [unclassified Pseudomonas]SEN08491.1 hypothetical protein SAMN04487857_109206 [Pseudomonas sp. ok272]SFM98683.1 hypothetical protein SAMN04487858_11013 [Pseudomonas sp. ok602]